MPFSFLTIARARLMIADGRAALALELLEALAGTGWVERVPWPTRPGEAPQMTAYAEGVRRLRGRARWWELDRDAARAMRRCR